MKLTKLAYFLLFLSQVTVIYIFLNIKNTSRTRIV